jgi:hypothetical protein
VTRRESTAKDILIALLDEAFDHPAWHGPTLRGSLRGVTPAQAAWRPGKERHSIREVAVHAAYWKYTVRRRLNGEKRGSFALEGSNWFGELPGRTWKDDVALLIEEHRKLRESVVAFPARLLQKPLDAQGRSAAFTIRGIAAHDLYHAGQIQLIKRMQGWRG